MNGERDLLEKGDRENKRTVAEYLVSLDLQSAEIATPKGDFAVAFLA
jgi:hypothetical protein